jgi:hypothetical protein
VDSAGLGQGPVAGSCQHGSEPVDPVGDGQFDDVLNNCRLLVKALDGGNELGVTATHAQNPESL